jgi:NAD(P)H-hydrate epimerase
MINKHQFQMSAKAFRAGRVSLQEFTDTVFAERQDSDESKSDQGNKTGNQLPPFARPGDQENLPQLASRPPQSHKGDFGRVLLIGGAAGMSGAISLAGLAVLKSGSGLVKVAVPLEIQPTVAAYSPCYMTLGCLSEHGEFAGEALDSLESEANWSDVVGLGPGLDQGAGQKWIVPKLYAATPQPMVVDADGLNTLAECDVNLAKHDGQRILTPHPGEFQRLVGSQITDREELEGRAIQLASTAGVIVVLKGNRTLVTDGERSFHNQTGNPGMATAGSGDVLTGVITSLVGQGLSLFDAAVLGVHVHGLAGDLAAQSVGETSLIATDIVDALPAAYKSHAAGSKPPIGFG